MVGDDPEADVDFGALLVLGPGDSADLVGDVHDGIHVEEGGGGDRPFLYEVCATVIGENEGAYPDLREKEAYITRVIRMEEESFAKTIDGGMRIFTEMLEGHKAKGEKTFSGADAFKLYDTYGFPIDLTAEMVAEEGMDVDQEGFKALMEEQRARARKAREALGDLGWAGVEFGKDVPATEFVGYGHSSIEDAKVVALVVENELAEVLMPGVEGIVVLDKTPFYAEMGGQSADHGLLRSAGCEFGHLLRLHGVSLQNGAVDLLGHPAQFLGGHGGEVGEVEAEVVLLHHTWTTPPRRDCSTSRASSPWPPGCAVSRPSPAGGLWTHPGGHGELALDVEQSRLGGVVQVGAAAKFDAARRRGPSRGGQRREDHFPGRLRQGGGLPGRQGWGHHQGHRPHLRRQGRRQARQVDVNIRRLRLKIEDNPQNPTFINTVWGFGYKWEF